MVGECHVHHCVLWVVALTKLVPCLKKAVIQLVLTVVIAAWCRNHENLWFYGKLNMFDMAEVLNILPYALIRRGLEAACLCVPLVSTGHAVNVLRHVYRIRSKTQVESPAS